MNTANFYSETMKRELSNISARPQAVLQKMRREGDAHVSASLACGAPAVDRICQGGWIVTRYCVCRLSKSEKAATLSKRFGVFAHLESRVWTVTDKILEAG